MRKLGGSWCRVVAVVTILFVTAAAQAQTRVRFTPAVAWNTTFVSGEPLVGDFDADGKDDLAVWSRAPVNGLYSNDLSVYLSEGHRFATPIFWSRGSSKSTLASALAGDFNGDGRDDVATVSSSATAPAVGGSVRVRLSNGQSFLPAPSWDTTLSRGPVNGSGQPVIRAGDVNGDGRDDLVFFVRESRTGAERGDVYVALSQGTWFEALVLWHDYFSIGAEIPMLGDVDGDGDADAVTFVRGSGGPADQGKVRVAPSDRISFRPWVEWHPFFCVGKEVPGLGDFDGDGATDAATFLQDTQGGDDWGKVLVARSSRTSFLSWTAWLAGLATGGAAPRVGDFNGDGQDDVLSWGAIPAAGGAWSTAVAVSDTSMSLTPRRSPTIPVMNRLSAFHTGGVDGIYLKRVGGAVLYANDEQTVFDPASAIKVVVETRALLDVRNIDPVTERPYNQLTDLIWVPANETPGGCPIADGMFVPRGLDIAVTRMMQLSDNKDTEAVRQLIGASSLDRSIAAFGMDSTRYLFPPGCGQNQTTLEDLGRVYEGVGRGLLEGQRNDFYRFSNTGMGLWPLLPLLDEYASLFGLPADFSARYRDRMLNVFKAGGGGDDQGQKRTLAGLVSLPYCTSSGTVYRDYAYGVFIDGATTINRDPATFQEFKLQQVLPELMRQELAAGVYSFATGGCAI